MDYHPRVRLFICSEKSSLKLKKEIICFLKLQIKTNKQKAECYPDPEASNYLDFTNLQPPHV